MPVKLFTLTTLRKFLNEDRVKKSHKPFTYSDVQGYIRRGALPQYLGGELIVKSSEIEGAKLYSLNEK